MKKGVSYVVGIQHSIEVANGFIKVANAVYN